MHTNESIGVPELARYIKRSQSYIAAKFKKEMGITIGVYIMNCKLEESKSLLKYTGKSLAEISSYLGFSSQSYFQNVFKRKYGITPAVYRKQSME
jgi:AraC-like DNA-binding protein